MLAQRGKVVNLPIEGDPHRSIFIGHGLVAGGAQIDDAESAVAEGDMLARILEDFDPSVIRAAMGNDIRHATDQWLVRLTNNSSDAAHALQNCSGRRAALRRSLLRKNEEIPAKPGREP